MTRAFVFPGQGSQAVGMGKELYDNFVEAREVFQEVDDTLSQKLSELIFAGPLEELTLTQNTQPALMATSVAVFRVLQKQGGLDLAKHAAFIAGHSLGEYSALCAGGALSLSDTAKLLRIRGNAMQEAVPQGEGGMGVLLGVDLDVAQKIAEKAAEGEVCQVANDNSPGQVVLSGAAGSMTRAGAVATEFGAKRFMPLNVSAPFHCQLMSPAAIKMKEALATVNIVSPAVPLVANVLAADTSDPATIRQLLVDQVTGMVRWRESILFMEQRGVTTTVELGAGKVLAGLTKRTASGMEGISIGTPKDIEEFIKTL